MSKRRIVIGKVLAVLCIVALLFFLLSSAFIVQISFRPYYFLHVGPLGIEESSGYSYEDISLAFNDVMDFLWLGAPFKTGNLAYSESGKEHFADCIPLFFLTLWSFVISSVLLIAYFILIKTKVLPKPRLLGFHPFFFASVIALLFLLVIVIIGLYSFDLLFELFHKVLFPGKENWVFDPYTDEIIRILPESFFLCCGIFAGIVAFLEIGAMLFLSLFWHHKERKTRRSKAEKSL